MCWRWTLLTICNFLTSLIHFPIIVCTSTYVMYTHFCPPSSFHMLHSPTFTVSQVFFLKLLWLFPAKSTSPSTSTGLHPCFSCTLSRYPPVTPRHPSCVYRRPSFDFPTLAFCSLTCPWRWRCGSCLGGCRSGGGRAGPGRAGRATGSASPSSPTTTCGRHPRRPRPVLRHASTRQGALSACERGKGRSQHFKVPSQDDNAVKKRCSSVQTRGIHSLARRDMAGSAHACWHAQH